MKKRKCCHSVGTCTPCLKRENISRLGEEVEKARYLNCGASIERRRTSTPGSPEAFETYDNRKRLNNTVTTSCSRRRGLCEAAKQQNIQQRSDSDKGNNTKPNQTNPCNGNTQKMHKTTAFSNGHDLQTRRVYNAQVHYLTVLIRWLVVSSGCFSHRVLPLNI